MPPNKTIAIVPPRRGARTAAQVPAAASDHDDELISIGPMLVRPARRILAQPHHSYRIGERLRIAPGGNTLARAASYCKVVSLLPYEGHGALLYRVRSEIEQFERIVPEADLSRT